jgi:hypothetical protein
MRIITPVPRITDDIDIELGPDAPCSLTFVKDRRPFCSNPAEWACQLACCGTVKTVCHQHRDIVASVLPKVFLCVSCGTQTPGVVRSWRI